MRPQWLGLAILITLVMFLFSAVSACSSPTPTPAPTPTATEPSRITPLPMPTATSATATADGETIMRRDCINCHPLARVTDARKNRAQWEQTISRMVRLASADQTVLLDYLAKTYGP